MVFFRSAAMALALAMLSCTPVTVHSQSVSLDGFVQSGQSLLGAVSSDSEQTLFGMSVALSSANGKRLVIGATKHDYNFPTAIAAFVRNNAGGIFVYDQDVAGTNWHRAWFMPGDEDEGLGERLSLSADGKMLAIRRNNNSTKMVQVFNLTIPTNVVQVGTFISCGSVSGSTVTMSPDGKRLAVSCEGYLSDTGRVLVFQEENQNWTLIGVLSGLAQGDSFGAVTSFSSDGNRLAVSSPGHDGVGGAFVNQGLVRVFQYPGSGLTWTLIGDLRGTNAFDQFGSSMALSGDGLSVVASSPGSGDAPLQKAMVGKVQVFHDESGTWTQQGSSIYGINQNDSFGRTVVITNNGTRIAATSFLHSNSRGQARVFDLDETGSFWQLHGSDIQGDNEMDRLGYGKLGLSMTSDGGRIAFGATNFGGTGRVRVFDSVPADTATFPVIESPTATPNTPAPSATLFVVEPSPSPFSVAPVPTLSPSSAPTTTLGKLDWDISLGSSSVMFNEMSSAHEIAIMYLIHRRTPLVRVFESDCTTVVSPFVIEVEYSTTPASLKKDSLDVLLDINEATISQSSIYTRLSPGTGRINICVRVDLLDADSNSVVFHLQKLDISVDMTKGFGVTDIDLERPENELAVNATFEYNVTACQCVEYNGEFECATEPVSPLTPVGICVETTAPNIEIARIEELTFIQGPLSQAAVNNGIEDALTEVAVDKKKAVIQTQLVSAFFDSGISTNVEAVGACSLMFVDDAGSIRRLRALIKTARMTEENVAGFEVDIELANGGDDASASYHTSGFMAIAFVLGAAILM